MKKEQLTMEFQKGTFYIHREGLVLCTEDGISNFLKGVLIEASGYNDYEESGDEVEYKVTKTTKRFTGTISFENVLTIIVQ